MAAFKNIFKLFPVLQERQNQQAGTLSGGEQQMLAIARGLMSKPKLLMLDEPSMGIMPKLITEIFEMIQRLNQEEGLTILLVEQNVQEALELAHYAYVLQSGSGIPVKLSPLALPLFRLRRREGGGEGKDKKKQIPIQSS